MDYNETNNPCYTKDVLSFDEQRKFSEIFIKRNKIRKAKMMKTANAILAFKKLERELPSKMAQASCEKLDNIMQETKTSLTELLKS